MRSRIAIAINSIAITPDGRRALAGSFDSTGSVELWDLESGRRVHALASPLEHERGRARLSPSPATAAWLQSATTTAACGSGTWSAASS